MRHFMKLMADDLWFRILVWIIGIAGLTLVVPFAFMSLYSGEAEREALRATLDNPALIAMIGPVPEGAYTVAVMFSHEMLVFMAIVHGLFGILIANAASRKMEDAGLLEYVSSLGITRQAIFMVQILIGIGMNLLLGLVIFAGLALMPEASFTVAGSALYAAGTSLFGLLFYVLTLVSAQVFPSSEWSFGVSLSLLLVLYLYRSITDVIDMTYSTVSPYHWLTRMAPFAEDNWAWLMGFLIIVVLVPLAWVLFAGRDLDSAYLSFSRDRKPRTIRTYPRLMAGGMKVLVTSWLVGMALIGASYGSIFPDLETFIFENEFLAQSMAASGEDPISQFISVLILITSLIGIIPALMITGRVLREEREGRLEWMESAGVRRSRVLVSHGVYAAVVGVLGIFLSMAAMYGASMGAEDIDVTFGDYVLATLNYGAVVLVFVGLSMLLIGISGRLHILVWVYVLYAFFVNYLGLIIGLGDGWRMATPFYYLAEVPNEAVDWPSLGVVAGIGVLLGVVGMYLFRKRNVG